MQPNPDGRVNSDIKSSQSKAVSPQLAENGIINVYVASGIKLDIKSGANMVTKCPTLAGRSIPSQYTDIVSNFAFPQFKI